MYTGSPVAETSERDLRFRRSIYAVIGALLIGYLAFKAWHVSIAIEAFDGQVIDADGRGAAR